MDATIKIIALEAIAKILAAGSSAEDATATDASQNERAGALAKCREDLVRALALVDAALTIHAEVR